jgi:hypothetical protein
MKAAIRILFLLIWFGPACACGAVTYGQDQFESDQKQAASSQRGSASVQSGERDTAQAAAARTGWILSDSAWASLIGAFIAALAYILNRSTAYRTATIEAQKLLVEINKQYIADPNLLIIEENYDAARITDENFAAKLKAMAYLKLNVFEVIFAALPYGRVRSTWKAYFKESLEKCSILADELDAHGRIYHRGLMRAYRKWKKKNSENTKRAAPAIVPSRPHALGWAPAGCILVALMILIRSLKASD